MNQKNKILIYKLFEKKFIFLFFVLSTCIFFLLYPIINNQNSKLSILITPNNNVLFETRNYYNRFSDYNTESDWLNKDLLLNDFLQNFSETNDRLKFKVKVVKDYYKTSTILEFNYNPSIKNFDKFILDSLVKSQNELIDLVQIRFEDRSNIYQKKQIKNAISQLFSDTNYNQSSTNTIKEFAEIHKLEKLELDKFFLSLRKKNIFTFKKIDVFMFKQNIYIKVIITIIFSLLSAFLINLAILIFPNYKKYI